MGYMGSITEQHIWVRAAPGMDEHLSVDYYVTENGKSMEYIVVLNLDHKVAVHHWVAHVYFAATGDGQEMPLEYEGHWGSAFDSLCRTAYFRDYLAPYAEIERYVVS